MNDSPGIRRGRLVFVVASEVTMTARPQMNRSIGLAGSLLSRGIQTMYYCDSSEVNTKDARSSITGTSAMRQDRDLGPSTVTALFDDITNPSMPRRKENTCVITTSIQNHTLRVIVQRHSDTPSRTGEAANLTPKQPARGLIKIGTLQDTDAGSE